MVCSCFSSSSATADKYAASDAAPAAATTTKASDAEPSAPTTQSSKQTDTVRFATLPSGSTPAERSGRTSPGPDTPRRHFAKSKSNQSGDAPRQTPLQMQASPITYITDRLQKGPAAPGRGRSRRASLPANLKAELAAIADSTGQLNKSFTQNLSRMSVASVKSDAAGAHAHANAHMHGRACGGDDATPFSGAVIVYEPGLEGTAGVVKLTRLIGKGGCGRVYTGEWNGQVVAVKVAVGYEPEGGRAAHCAECWPQTCDRYQFAGEDSKDELIAALETKRERMTQLEAVLMSKLFHPNIIRTHRILSCAPGIAAAAGPDDVEAMQRIREEGYLDAEHIPSTYRWYIIMEYAPLGSLWQGLRQGRFHRQASDCMSVCVCVVCLFVSEKRLLLNSSYAPLLMLSLTTPGPWLT